MDKITIITPTYNDAQYIDNLCTSIKSQTNKNFEWIVIDDGSSNQNKQILQEKVECIENSRVIYNSNEGVSISRDYALKAAKTKWVIFIDVDDTININLVEEFYKVIESTNKYKLLVINFDVRPVYNSKRSHLKVNRNDLKTTFGSISNKIFIKDELINSFNYKYKIGEDLDLFIRYVNKLKSKEIGIVNSSFIWQKRKNSTIRNLSNGNYLDILSMANSWNDKYDLSVRNNRYILSAITEHAYIYTYIRFHMDGNKNNNREQYNLLKNHLKPKNIIITKRTFTLFIMSVLFKFHLQWLARPAIAIYRKWYLSSTIITTYGLKPKFSVIIPCYNIEKYLPDFLKNIPISRNDFELIFINDASTDNTLSILKKFIVKNKHFKLINLNKNMGVAEAINVGSKHMTTNWYARLDPDDIVFESYFDEIPKYLNNDNVLIRYKFKIYKNNKIKNPNFLRRLYFKHSWGWSCLLNISILGKIPKIPNDTYEDLYTFSSMYKKTNKKEIFINKYLVAYRIQRMGSITDKKYITEAKIDDLERARLLYKNNNDIKWSLTRTLLLIKIYFEIKFYKRKLMLKFKFTSLKK